MQAWTAPFKRVRAVGAEAWRRADQRLESIRGLRDLRACQCELRQAYARVFGPLPDPHARVSASLGGILAYRDLQARPIRLRSPKGYAITGWTFQPRNPRRRVPGLVIAAGHVEDGSLHEPYLKLALFAAQCGLGVFSFDPPGQGGRREVFLKEDDPVDWDACKQHQHLGVAALIAGFGLNHFFACDCVTAVSFLAQQPWIDAARIGFTGQSGGGLQTFFAMGADRRIRAAVPIQATSSRRGAFAQTVFRDIEQTPPRVWPEGLDLHEMVLLFAPRPVRILAEFGHPDQGDIVRRLAPVYDRLGFPERIEIASANATHDLSRSCRELALNWFHRHLVPARPLANEPAWTGFEKFLRRLREHAEKWNAAGCGVMEWCRRHVTEKRKHRPSVRRALENNAFLVGCLRRRRCRLWNRHGHPIERLKPGVAYCGLAPDYRVPFTLFSGRGTKGTAVTHRSRPDRRPPAVDPLHRPLSFQPGTDAQAGGRWTGHLPCRARRRAGFSAAGPTRPPRCHPT